jgi:hypothetical protein
MSNSMAETFKRWVNTKGKTVTLRTRTVTGYDGHGDPTESFTNSTIYAHVFEDRSILLQTEQGIQPEVAKILHVPYDTNISELDHVIIDTIEYVCSVPNELTAYISCRVMRLVQ